MSPAGARAALYARVSTVGQTEANQLLALTAHAQARGWTATEFVDHGVSGAKEKRPALDRMLAEVRRRKVDVVAVVKLDRLARSVRQLVSLAGEFGALGVDLVVLDQAIDTSVPAGRLMFHMLSAIAEFERDLIRDRVLAGLRRAKAQGTRSGKRIGRPRTQHVALERAKALLAAGQSLRAVARELGVHPTAITRAVGRVANPARKPLAKVASLRASSRRSVAVANQVVCDTRAAG